MTRLRQNKGVTLLEVTIAAALGAIIMLGGYTLMMSSIRENSKADTNNEGWLEATNAGTAFDTLVKNAPRIVPPEDLSAAGDALYQGIAPLDASSAPSECLVNAKFSALRVTSISLKQPSAALLRAWFTSSAGATHAADELRLTYPADPAATPTMFGAQNPTELFLIDADGVNKRRYSVASVKILRNSHTDPYDDVVKPAQLFNYVSVLLDNPATTSGASALPPTPPISFITQSLAYASRTSVICVVKADPAKHQDSTLMELTSTQRLPLINLDHQGVGSKSRLSVEGFRVSFVAATQAGRFDSLVPFTDLFTNPAGPCMSGVRFDIDLGMKADARQAAPAQAAVHLSRTLHLPNFYVGRPVVCP